MESFLSNLGLETFWERTDFLGILLVVIGVAGESLLEFKTFPYNPTGFENLELFLGKTKKVWEKYFTGLVAVGVGIEMLATPMVLKESHKEIEGLRNANLELQAKLQPRLITLQKEKQFISLCGDIPKMPIKVIIGAADNEAVNFAKEIRQALDDAGFSCTNGGIISDQSLFLATKIGAHSASCDIILVKNDTNVVVNAGGIVFIPNGIWISNGIESFPTNNISQIAVVDVVASRFNSIGIKPAWVSTNLVQYLDQRTAAILVMQKNAAP
jgi:hypothetical protein